jgi:hypothetical protein
MEGARRENRRPGEVVATKKLQQRDCRPIGWHVCVRTQLSREQDAWRKASLEMPALVALCRMPHPQALSAQTSGVSRI